MGNGERIRVWGDRWLLTVSHSRIIMQRVANEEVYYVKDLIMQHNRQWDPERIQDLFLPIHANAILGIPLSH